MTPPSPTAGAVGAARAARAVRVPRRRHLQDRAPRGRRRLCHPVRQGGVEGLLGVGQGAFVSEVGSSVYTAARRACLSCAPSFTESLSPRAQVGVALLEGRTCPPAPVEGPQAMSYEKETVSADLDAHAEVRCAAARCAALCAVEGGTLSHKPPPCRLFPHSYPLARTALPPITPSPWAGRGRHQQRQARDAQEPGGARPPGVFVHAAAGARGAGGEGLLVLVPQLRHLWQLATAAAAARLGAPSSQPLESPLNHPSLRRTPRSTSGTCWR